MDFDAVIKSAKQFAGSKRNRTAYNDLLVDRLHHRYTVAALVCFCIAVSTYQYAGKDEEENEYGTKKLIKIIPFLFLGDPLKCWVPAQFTDNYESYTNRLCYIQNTYHVAKYHSVPKDPKLRHERTLKYYQWINFVLLLQAFFFGLPRILWQSFSDKIGLSLGHLVDAAHTYESFDGDDTDRNKGMYCIT